MHPYYYYSLLTESYKTEYKMKYYITNLASEVKAKF